MEVVDLAARDRGEVARECAVVPRSCLVRPAGEGVEVTERLLELRSRAPGRRRRGRARATRRIGPGPRGARRGARPRPSRRGRPSAPAGSGARPRRLRPRERWTTPRWSSIHAYERSCFAVSSSAACAYSSSAARSSPSWSSRWASRASASQREPSARTRIVALARGRRTFPPAGRGRPSAPGPRATAAGRARARGRLARVRCDGARSRSWPS